MNAVPTHADFQDCLEDLLQKFGHVGEGTAAATGISSHKVAKGAKPKRSLEDYDYSTGKVDGDWDHSRKVAYLAAYVKFFGPKFSYERFEFSEGHMYADKANMKTHLKYGCIVPTSAGRFAITEKGRALIAPFVKVTDAEMEAAHAC